MTGTETMVRMGELAVSSVPGHVLVSLGLGSCIGLALLDRKMGIAGLAHIVLPQSQGHGTDNSRKFADFAVPELVSELEAEGARKVRLEAVLVGGASMFAVSNPSLEVGQRNEAAVRELLKAMRIPVKATATGGNKGRTIRVDVATAAVTVREAGGKDAELLPGTRALEALAA
jgi:chemotaxis protein CheD